MNFKELMISEEEGLANTDLNKPSTSGPRTDPR